MGHIFISYSRKNQHYARQLADLLLGLGFDVWIDDQIDYGDRWHRVIFKAIKECAALIVIMTPASNDSEWVEKEYLYADELRKPVFPLLLEGDRFPYFVNCQYADVRSGHLPGNDFIRHLEVVTARKPQGGDIHGDTRQSKSQTIPHRSTNDSPLITPIVPSKKIDSHVYALLPAPFAWVEVPAGTVTLINTWDDDPQSWLKRDQPRNFLISSFIIAKYPITNAQYGKFIQAGGYREARWWTQVGWATLRREKWSEPVVWGSKTLNRAAHPVVGISWYEATAFCNWLSHASGESIVLPSEYYWQRAAQGNDRRIFPWGNRWDGSLCNNNVPPFGSTQTTPVTEFEGRGCSPFGVADVAGNCWEWCSSLYTVKDTGFGDDTGYRVLRGGAYKHNEARYFRVDMRGRCYPEERDASKGFRIARA